MTIALTIFAYFINFLQMKGGFTMNEDKAFSNAKWFAIGLLVLAIIVLIFNFVTSPSQNIIKIVSYSIQIILLLATAIGCNINFLGQARNVR